MASTRCRWFLKDSGEFAFEVTRGDERSGKNEVESLTVLTTGAHVVVDSGYAGISSGPD